jgi:uncharacterized lipoprotein YajG
MNRIIAIAVAMLFAGCATVPTANQVVEIKMACSIDAGIRPTITALLAIPDLAKPEEVAVVGAARAIIDPICANPSGSLQEDALSAVAGATGQIVGIVTALQARK